MLIYFIFNIVYVCLLFCDLWFCRIMSRNRAQSSKGSQRGCPWLDFPQIGSKSTLLAWKRKLEKLKKKEFYLPNEIDWSCLEQWGLVERMNPHLTKVFIQDGVRITCDAWRRLFRLQEPVYQELCWEFYSTIKFRGSEDYFDTNALTFMLGGEFRECSVVELAWRMDLYEQNVAMTEAFGIFMEACHKDLPNIEDASRWWSTIANGVYIPSAAQEASM